MNFTTAKWQQDSDGELWLMLKICKDSHHAAKKFVAEIKDKLYTAILKEHREKRSLDANAYMWVLLEKMSQVLRTDKDSLYLEVLSRYGVFTHIVVKPHVAERVKSEWRTVRELGEVTINGQTGIQLQCYFGSSTYDKKEMARLIDGIVSECKDLEIETMPPEKLSAMKEQWG